MNRRIVRASRPSQGRFFVFALLTGAALGAAIGLLLAPKTGTEFRGDIADSVEGLRRRIGNVSRDVADAAATLAESGQAAYDQARDAIANAPRAASRTARTRTSET
jgi:gas vesicle protein